MHTAYTKQAAMNLARVYGLRHKRVKDGTWMVGTAKQLAAFPRYRESPVSRAQHMLVTAESARLDRIIEAKASVEQQLPDVSSRYGAPMGRPNLHADRDLPYEFGVYPVRFVDGDYDNGGAYWGGGRDSLPLWRALGKKPSLTVEFTDREPAVELYLRADTSDAAVLQVRAEYPLARFPSDLKMDAGFQEFVIGYLTCALWISNDYSDESGGSPLDTNYQIDDIDPASRLKLEAECEDFYTQAAELWATDEYTDSRAGHDFWLTRNRHGVGFWDRDLTNGDELTERAEAFGEVNIVVGDDGKLHAE